MLYLTARNVIPRPVQDICGTSWGPNNAKTMTVAAIRIALAALGALAIYKLGISSTVAIGAVAVGSLPATAILGGSLLMYKGIVVIAAAGSLKSLALGWIALSTGGSCLSLYERASSLRNLLETPYTIQTKFTISVPDDYDYSMGILESVFRE